MSTGAATTTAPTADPPDAAAEAASRWTQVHLLLRTEHLRVLRRWAVEEDRPVELHLARLLRLAALEHQGAPDAR